MMCAILHGLYTQTLFNEGNSLQKTYKNCDLVNRLVLLKQDCLARLFLGTNTNYSVHVYMFYHIVLQAQPLLHI